MTPSPAPLPPSRARRWLSRLGLVVGGLVVGVIAAELLARLIEPHGAADILFNAPGNAPDGLYVTDKELLHRPNPGLNVTVRSLGYEVPIRVNSLGLRGAEPGPETTTPRWLIQGDSFTFAAQVREEETTTVKLGALLGWETFNGGADAWGTHQAAPLFRRLAEPLGLDGLVIVFFLGNDLFDNERYPMERQRHANRPDGNPMVGGFTHPVVRFFTRRSYLLGQWRVQSALREFAREGSPERGRWRGELRLFTQEGQGELGGKLRATETALLAAKRATEERGAKLVVAIAPPAFVVEEDRLAPTFGLVGLDPAKAELDGPERQVKALLDRLGVASCSLTEPLRVAAKAGEAPYFQYDGHWTAAGHTVVAHTLASCLETPR